METTYEFISRVLFFVLFILAFPTAVFCSWILGIIIGLRDKFDN